MKKRHTLRFILPPSVVYIYKGPLALYDALESLQISREKVMQTFEMIVLKIGYLTPFLAEISRQSNSVIDS